MSSEQKPKVDLGILEEDDEFEEFPAEDWTARDEDEEDISVWEDNWDDDNVEDDFSQQLSFGFKMTFRKVCYLCQGSALITVSLLDQDNIATHVLFSPAFNPAIMRAGKTGADFKCLVCNYFPHYVLCDSFYFFVNKTKT